MDEFIMEIPGAASQEFCEALIAKYELDNRAGTSRIGPQGTYDKTVRDSTNLEMNLLADWHREVDELRGMIYSRLPNYLDNIHVAKTHSMFEGGYDSSYTMMKYVPGSVGYTWHNDFMYDDFSKNGGVRTITWLFYINDGYEGGETEFHWGRKIKPEQGKLVLFPSCWTFVHRGNPVTAGTKYLGVGWLYSTWNRGMNCRSR